MSDSLGFLITDVARMLRREFDARVRAIGVTRPQWRVLSFLNRSEGINQGGLAELLEVEPISVGRMVDRLQEAGLVERRADPADRRAWRLFLTDRSRALIEELRPIAEATLDDTMAGFAPEERQTLIDYLERVRANLSRQPQELAVANG
jgi:DNA-binding MarR family transcriptional regulator